MTLTCEQADELAAGYVLDALDEDERLAVRAHLATCPKAHEQFEHLGGVVPYLADTVTPIEPPTALRDRILAAAAQQPQGHAVTATEPFVMPSRPRVRPWRLDVGTPSVPSGRPALVWLGATAATILIVVLGGLAFLRQVELDSVRRYDQAVATVLEVAASEGGQLAVLSSEADGGAFGIGAVGVDGRVALALRELSPTDGSEVYEAWVIAGEHAPVPIGGFRVDDSGTGAIVSSTRMAAEPVVLAVTREPGPGATEPTGPIVASGPATDLRG